MSSSWGSGWGSGWSSSQWSNSNSDWHQNHGWMQPQQQKTPEAAPQGQNQPMPWPSQGPQGQPSVGVLQLAQREAPQIQQVAVQQSPPHELVEMVEEVIREVSHFGANPAVLATSMADVNSMALASGMSGPQFWVLPCLSLALGPYLPHSRNARISGLTIGADPSKDASFALIGGNQLVENQKRLTTCCCGFQWDAATTDLANVTKTVYATYICEGGPALIFLGDCTFSFPASTLHWFSPSEVM